MALSTSILFQHLLLFLFIFHHPPPSSAAGGSWSLLVENAGVSAMHMQLLPNDRVVMFDRTEFGKSAINLPKCLPDLADCSAHSVEFDVEKKTIRPLTIRTDTWCSSGSLTPDGNLVQTGGNGNGAKGIRVYKSCDTCDWQETPNGMAKGRWYATNHILPDHRQIVIGGRQEFNYEFVPKGAGDDQAIDLPFLAQTNDVNENNLYPPTFLYSDGNLFIFANNRAILFDYVKNQVVKTYPTMPGGEPRSYPSSGSAVLLPLHVKKGVVDAYEVLVCGGAHKEAFNNALNGKFDEALGDCGRIKISDPNPQWVMEAMPGPRVMGDMVLLPNGHVLIINGATKGVAGWDLGRDPAFHPVIYRPDNKIGSRFEEQNPSDIPRVYHSTAVLLRDGRVLVAGSNPHEKYEFGNVLFPTELRVESFSPDYLEPGNADSRPEITAPNNNLAMQYGKHFDISFTVKGPVDPNMVSVTMLAPPFNTHSFSMNQRLLFLDSDVPVKDAGKNSYTVGVTAPPSANIAPGGYYLVFVVHKDVPSPGIWAKIE
ncbi:putative galactose oxidase [Helianthus annuus]|nr:putative galactose oxidase [Helianthus annuus]KAJ0639504.1 putative galactose oxidase [Helianthus annuus]KAJ0819580.1 putative galactose oxidase [Helianthus annuus]